MAGNGLDGMTVEEFLRLERERLDQPYEFRNGQMVAMSGGTVNHSTIISNVVALLHAHVRKTPCRVLSESTLKCYLPDIMITCHEKDIAENKTYIEHPKLVIEVLSPTTEKDDRTDKVWTYTECLSIKEYLLVNWDVKIVQKMTRKGWEGRYQWIDSWYGQDKLLELDIIGVPLAIEDIYENIVLPLLDAFQRQRRRRPPNP